MNPLKLVFDIDLTKLRGGLSKASSEIRDWSLVVTGLTGGVSNAFKTIGTVGVKSVVVALAGMTTAFAVTAKSGAEFEDSIVRAFTIMKESSGATEGALKSLTDEAIRLGSETLFSANQAAEGFEVLARAGFNATEQIAALPEVINLAIVGNIGLAEASDAAVASMFGFGIEAANMARVTDVLSLASAKANTTIPLLQSAMSFVAPVAHSAGISIEETAASIGVMSNAGIRGSRAGTTLRRAMSILLAPTGKAKKIFDELGLTFNSAEGGLKSFTSIIKDLGEANLTAAQTQTIFGRIAGPGMAALLAKGSDALQSYTTDLENSGGTAGKMAQEFRTTVVGRVKDLTASIINLGLGFSQSFQKPLADTIFGLRNYVKDVTEAWNQTGNFKAVVDGVINALSPLTGMTKEAAKGFKEMLIALTPEDIDSFFESMKDKIQSFLDKIVEMKESIISAFQGAILVVKSFVGSLVTIAKVFDSLPSSIQPFVAKMATAFATLTHLMGGLSALIGTIVILKFVVGPLIGLFTGVSIAVSTASKVIGGLAAHGTAAIVATTGLGSSLLAVAAATWAFLWPILAVVAGVLLVTEVLNSLAGNKFGGITKAIWEGMGKGIKKVIGMIGGGLKGAISGIGKMGQKINPFNKLVDQAQEAKDGIDAVFESDGDKALSGLDKKIESLTAKVINNKTREAGDGDKLHELFKERDKLFQKNSLDKHTVKRNKQKDLEDDILNQSVNKPNGMNNKTADRFIAAGDAMERAANIQDKSLRFRVQNQIRERFGMQGGSKSRIIEAGKAAPKLLEKNLMSLGNGVNVGKLVDPSLYNYNKPTEANSLSESDKQELISKKMAEVAEESAKLRQHKSANSASAIEISILALDAAKAQAILDLELETKIAEANAQAKKNYEFIKTLQSRKGGNNDIQTNSTITNGRK